MFKGVCGCIYFEEHCFFVITILRRIFFLLFFLFTSLVWSGLSQRLSKIYRTEGSDNLITLLIQTPF